MATIVYSHRRRLLLLLSPKADTRHSFYHPAEDIIVITKAGLVTINKAMAVFAGERRRGTRTWTSRCLSRDLSDAANRTNHTDLGTQLYNATGPCSARGKLTVGGPVSHWEKKCRLPLKAPFSAQSLFCSGGGIEVKPVYR